jgi:hypothetical protein
LPRSAITDFVFADQNAAAHAVRPELIDELADIYDLTLFYGDIAVRSLFWWASPRDPNDLGI